MEDMHGSGHSLAMRRLFLGESEADDADVLRLLESCADCRRELQALRAAADRLDAAGREQADELIAARQPSGGTDIDVVGMFAAIAARELGAQRRASRRWLWAAAAVVLGGVSLVFLLESPDPKGEDVIMIGEDAALSILHPKGEVAGYAPFRWTYDGSDAAAYNLRIYAGPRTDGAEPFRDIPFCTDTEWTPSASEELPRQIEWEVEALDAFGNTLARSGPVSASLR